MKINEIFLSIEGEGKEQGNPTIFIRTHGCNNLCTYCDTTYAVNENIFEELTTTEVVEKVQEFLPYYYVCITGGEPLIQDEMIDLVKELSPYYQIWIETNGTRDIRPYSGRENVHIVMDIKCPSSGMADKTLWRNVKFLRKQDQIKFVIATEKDYQFAKNLTNILSYLCPVQILFSPCLYPADKPEIKPDQLVKKILNDRLFVRYSLQIHKYIWNPRKRGV